MLTRENEGSKKSVRKVVQDFVHQQYDLYSGWWVVSQSAEDLHPRNPIGRST